MQDPEEGRPMEGRAFRNIGKNIYYIFPTVKSALPLLFKDTQIFFKDSTFLFYGVQIYRQFR